MRVSMEAKELKTYRLALKVLDGKLTIKEFSELIGKSYRQSQRIIKSVKEKDYFGVIHGNRGRSPVNKTSDSVEGQIKDWLDYK